MTIDIPFSKYDLAISKPSIEPAATTKIQFPKLFVGFPLHTVIGVNEFLNSVNVPIAFTKSETDNNLTFQFPLE